MSTQRTITIQFDDREYERLEAAARRKGTSPDILIREYVHDSLRDDIFDDPEAYQQVMYDALDALDQFASTMPPFDAEKIVREGREELEERSPF